MKTKYLFTLLVAFALLLGACAPAKDAPDPAEIAQSLYKALNDGDIEAAMALVAEDVTVRGDMYLNSKESLRSFFQGIINQGGRTDISDLKVEGDKVTYNWEAYSKAGFLEATGVETLQIKDGLIIFIETVANM